MDKKRVFSSLVVISLIVGGCAKSSKLIHPDVQSEQKPIIITTSVANATTNFAFDFFKTLQTDPQADAKENIFVSPLSLHIALGMLVNGATQETKNEIIDALKANNISLEDLNIAYKKLLTELPQADPKVKMALANAIFYKNSFNVLPTFFTEIQNNFNAQITGLPFNPSDAAIINQWASDHTNGKIKKILDTIHPDLVMLLMNALYFKGDWSKKFDTKRTADANFNLEKGSKLVKMMTQKDSFQYAVQPNFTALQMPYGNGQFTATLLLPNENSSIKTLMNDFTSEKWNALQNALQTRNITIQIPKFKLEQEFKLENSMQKMGIIRAFNDKTAELKKINETAKLYVDFIQQNTYLAVDEEGTEAAAVTTIGIGVTSAPQELSFICNRPFGIIISEKTSNTILFMGRIMNPSN